MCPGQQCGLSFPCLWTLPVPRPWHLNSLLDVRAVELSEHVHIEAGMGALLRSHLPNGMRCFEQVSS